MQKSWHVRTLLWLIIWGCAATIAAQSPSDQPRLSANDVMRLTYSYAARNNLSVGQFNAEIYLRTRLETERKNFLMRYVPGQFKLRHGFNEYVGETQLHFSYTYPGMIDKKIIASYTNIPRSYDLREQILSNFNVSTYATSLWTERVLSPFHRKNRHYYRYDIDSVFVADTTMRCIMRITPRFKNTQLVSGRAEINVYTGQVYLFSLHGFYDMRQVYVTAILGDAGKASLLPKEVYVNVNLKLLGNEINTSYLARIKTTDLSDMPTVLRADSATYKNKYDKSHNYHLREDTTAMRSDIGYFDSIRPVALSEEERYLYHEKQRYERTLAKNVTQTDSKVGFGEIMEDVFLDGHYINLKNKGQIKLPPLLSPEMLRWSKNRGLFIYTRLKLDYRHNEDVQIISRPRVGYNFKQQEWHFNIPLELRLNAANNLIVKAEGGKLNNIQSNEQYNELVASTLPPDSLSALPHTPKFNDYRNYYTRLEASVDCWHGFNIAAALSYYCRSLTDWSVEAESLGMHKHLRTLSVKGSIKWTPGLYYYRRGKQKISLHSKWPAFYLSYEQGLKTEGIESDFARWEFNMSYLYKLYALRTLYMRAGAGYFMHKRKSYFVDFEQFHDNQLSSDLADDMMGRFHLLPGHLYNQSRYYVLGTTAYESPMLLISRINLLSKFIQKERLYYNMVITENLRPYVEIGYGIATHAIDFGIFVGGADRKNMSVGCAIELRLFDDWRK